MQFYERISLAIVRGNAVSVEFNFKFSFCIRSFENVRVIISVALLQEQRGAFSAVGEPVYLVLTALRQGVLPVTLYCHFSRNRPDPGAYNNRLLKVGPTQRGVTDGRGHESKGYCPTLNLSLNYMQLIIA